MARFPKSKGLRLYFERKSKSYILVDTSLVTPNGSFECVGETLLENDPKQPLLGTSSCNPSYLYRYCKRVEWSEMPRVWRGALRKWITGSPLSHRGLWRVRKD